MAEHVDKTSRYRNLELNRRRAEELAFTFNRIPVDDDHEAFIRQQEREEKERSVQQEFASSVCSISPGQKDKRPLNSRFQDTRSFSGSTASTQPDLMDLRRGDDESSTSRSDGESRGEILPKNMRCMLLLFENRKHFKCEVLLDSGTAENWISERTVKENGIPWDPEEEDEENRKEYEDVNGRIVKSCGIVHAQWSFRGQTRQAKLNIAKGSTASWQVIFGYLCLLRNNLITFHHDKSEGLVAPLIQKTRKPPPAEKQQIKRNEERSQATSSAIRDFLEWKKDMRHAGWHWDKEQKNFYKEAERGRKEWCKDGWQLNIPIDNGR